MHSATQATFLKRGGAYLASQRSFLRRGGVLWGEGRNFFRGVVWAYFSAYFKASQLHLVPMKTNLLVYISLMWLEY